MNAKKIKICGINDINILQNIINLKIDYVGFIFYEKSPRYVDEKFLKTLNKINFKKIRPVCVYVNPDEDFVYKTSSYFTDPILQFHGNEDSSFCESFGLEFWKAIRVKTEDDLESIADYSSASGILLENHKHGEYGGTGESFNWEILKKIDSSKQNLILSGGINSKNVDNALTTNSWCIDINSGVESEVGKKDINLITNILDIIDNHDL
jgi:phosphoribosylanthranilate isomerase